MTENDNYYDEEDKEDREIPVNQLDLQLMTVNSKWGKDINSELQNRLYEIGLSTKDGQLKTDKKKLWGLLSYYTRDMRLGNLDRTTYSMASQWLDFAGDCLRLNWGKSFLTALSRVITMLELSQSKGGFLRKRLGTSTKESFNEFRESDKKQGLFNKNPKNGGGY